MMAISTSKSASTNATQLGQIQNEMADSFQKMKNNAREVDGKTKPKNFS
jgi:hypothetical protein